MWKENAKCENELNNLVNFEKETARARKYCVHGTTKCVEKQNYVVKK